MLSLSSNRRIAAVCLAAGCLAAACAPQAQAVAPDILTTTNTVAAQEVKLTEVKTGDITMLSTGGARLELVNSTEISFTISDKYSAPQAYVVEYLVKSNALVEAGDPLLTVLVDQETLRVKAEILAMDIATAKEAVAAVRKNRTTALQNYDARRAEEENADRKEIIRLEKRIYELQSANSITREEDALARMEAQQTLYTALQEPFTVVAPARGIVQDLNVVREGYPISQGTFICNLSALDKYRIVMWVSAADFRPGMPVTLTKADKTTFTGIIGTEPFKDKEIGYSTKGTFFFIRPDEPISNPEEHLLNVFPVLGSFAEVKDTVVVPELYVKAGTNDTKYATVMVNGAPEKRIVTVGVFGSGNVQIVSGLHAGDMLVE